MARWHTKGAPHRQPHVQARWHQAGGAGMQAQARNRTHASAPQLSSGEFQRHAQHCPAEQKLNGGGQDAFQQTRIGKAHTVGMACPAHSACTCRPFVSAATRSSSSPPAGAKRVMQTPGLAGQQRQQQAGGWAQRGSACTASAGSALNRLPAAAAPRMLHLPTKPGAIGLLPSPSSEEPESSSSSI